MPAACWKLDQILEDKWKIGFFPYEGDYLTMDGLLPCEKPGDITLTKLVDLGGRKWYPRFGGKMIYTCEFVYDGNGMALLDLGEVGESAEVWSNGENAGLRFAPPYSFEIGHLYRRGQNQLKIEVENNLSRACCLNSKEGHGFWDTAFMYNVLDRSGLLGPVKIFKSNIVG